MRERSRPTRARGLKLLGDGLLLLLLRSRPTRARGLKLAAGFPVRIYDQVAPYAGAWVETIPFTTGAQKTWSRPTRARGLKPSGVLQVRTAQVSRPTRARGLKLMRGDRKVYRAVVAPYAGAWVETTP